MPIQSLASPIRGFTPTLVSSLSGLALCVACGGDPEPASDSVEPSTTSTTTSQSTSSSITSTASVTSTMSSGSGTTGTTTSTGSGGSGGSSSTATTSQGSSVGGSTATSGTGGSTTGELTTSSGSGGTGISTTFSTPEGTIPNLAQPGSTIDLSPQSWRDGIISPTDLNKGHQINQPSVVNGYLLIGGNEEFWFYDVSDPTDPQEVSYIKTPNATGGEAESHTLSFARYGDRYYMVTIGGRGIDTWDITDVRAPEHLAQLRVPGTNYGDYTEAIWGVTWQGQYIYVGATNNGVKVVDAADPSSPSIVGEISPSQYGGVSAGALDAIGNVLVLSTPKESGGVATLDISDPTNPTRLASFSTQLSYIGMFYRRWVFLLNPLRVWDVLSDPRNIGSGSSPIGQLNHNNAEYLSFSDDFMFLGHVRAEIGGTPGASKISVENPSSMRVVSSVWGRQDLNGLNDDQFVMPMGNLIVIGDDQSPYPGWFIAVHATDPDTVAPEVDTVIPKPDSSGVATTSRIGITFSDNIELATINAASFIVRPVGGQPLAGKFGVRMGVVNFDPDEELEPGTTYEVVLPEGGIADLVGNTLTAQWTSTFTTN